MPLWLEIFMDAMQLGSLTLANACIVLTRWECSHEFPTTLCVSVVQGQFNKLRSICVAAEQGMRSLAQRLGLALEAPALTLGPAAPAVGHDTGSPLSAAGQHGTGPGSRLTSAGGLSNVSGSHGAGMPDGMRRSGAGSTGSAHHRRPSRDHGLDAMAQQAALASKAQRCVAKGGHTSVGMHACVLHAVTQQLSATGSCW